MSVKSKVDWRNIDTIVFLVRRPVAALEAEKWEFDFLRSQGLNVEILDISQLLYTESASKQIAAAVVQPLYGGFIHTIKTYPELAGYLERFSGHCLLVDYVVGVSNVSPKTERIFRLLRKHNVRYTFLTLGALPLPQSDLIASGSQFKLLVLKVARLVVSPQRLWNFIASRMILLLMRNQIIYSLPTVIFGGDSEVLRHYLKVRGMGRDKVVPVHSSDYDSSVLFLRSCGNKLPEPENICVFLDEALTHHSDFSILGIRPAEPTIYFETMNRFFNFIEQTTGNKVVIAAHPRSNYESMGDVFAGRSIIKGKTVELVARSKQVVMHMSTSLSFAVLFKKPLTVVKIPGMPINGSLNIMVETMASAIGCEAVDLDSTELVPEMIHDKCNLEKYFEYQRRYVKTENAEDMPAWEIVVNWIKKQNKMMKTS